MANKTAYYKIKYQKWYGLSWSRKIFASSEKAAIEIFKLDYPDKIIHNIKIVGVDKCDMRDSLL